MSKNIQTSIAYLTQCAEEVESSIDSMADGGNIGCQNCGFLTVDDIENDRLLREAISELTEISEALEYLKAML